MSVSSKKKAGFSLVRLFRDKRGGVAVIDTALASADKVAAAWAQIATAAIAELPTCSLVRWSSVRMIGISGAIPNQPKKHRKKASHVM